MAGAASAAEVTAFHTKSDVDSGKQSQHHTLGGGPNNAAPGNHSHTASDTAPLLDGVILTGAKGGNAAVASIISALVNLGAIDNTTA